jgi:hypothetical protein
MEEPNNSNTVTIFLLLVVCSLFVTIDGLELYRLVDQWDYALRSFHKETFEHCIQFPIIARTAFTIFSFMAAFSSFLIAFLLSINVDFFIEKNFPCLSEYALYGFWSLYAWLWASRTILLG